VVPVPQNGSTAVADCFVKKIKISGGNMPTAGTTYSTQLFSSSDEPKTSMAPWMTAKTSIWSGLM
jgi:hypothetical protein